MLNKVKFDNWWQGGILLVFGAFVAKLGMSLVPDKLIASALLITGIIVAVFGFILLLNSEPRSKDDAQ